VQQRDEAHAALKALQQVGSMSPVCTAIHNRCKTACPVDRPLKFALVLCKAAWLAGDHAWCMVCMSQLQCIHLS
jgi:hypothetical protein